MTIRKELVPLELSVHTRSIDFPSMGHSGSQPEKWKASNKSGLRHRSIMVCHGKEMSCLWPDRWLTRERASERESNSRTRFPKVITSASVRNHAMMHYTCSLLCSGQGKRKQGVTGWKMVFTPLLYPPPSILFHPGCNHYGQTRVKIKLHNSISMNTIDAISTV